MDWTNEHKTWVVVLAGDAPDQHAAVAAQDKAAGLLQVAWTRLEPKVEEVRLGEAYVMKMRKDGLGGFLKQTFRIAPKKMAAISKDGDLDKEFDTGHDLKKAAGLTPEQASSLMRAHSMIVQEVDTLRAATDADGKPLFAEARIAKEIWEPLMRRKIIPENAITNASSAQAATFQGGAEQYDVRLAAYTDSLGSNEGIAAKLGLGSGIIKGAGSAANGVMTALTATVPGMKGFSLTEAKDVCSAISITLAGGADIAATVLRNPKFDAKNVEAIAKSVSDMATGWVTAGFDIKFPDQTDKDEAVSRALGAAINAGLKAGLSGTVFATKIVKGETADALAQLGTLVEQCCTCAGSDQTYHGTDNSLAVTGRQMNEAITSAVALGAVLTSDDPAKALAKALQTVVQNAVNEGSKTYMTARQAERKLEDDTEDKKRFDADFEKPADIANQAGGTAAVGAMNLDGLLKLAQTKSVDELKVLFKTELADMKDKQALLLEVAEKRDQDLAAAAAAMSNEVAQSDAAFRSLLDASQARESDQDVEQIELLILEVKKSQMAVAMAEGILKMGPAVLAAFLPPASIAVDAMGMMIAMRKAAVHLLAFEEWNENVADARSAMSPVVAGMVNRAGLSKTQAVRKGVEALEKAISMVGNILGTAGGPVAGAGIAVAQGISALSSLKDIILRLYDEKQLRDGWSRYQKARANPDDRKAMRAAIRGNPTLAKYTIAYAGVTSGDPVAKNALQKCGLNAKVLQSPNTNQQKVVTYLEAVYADDPVLLHKVKAPPKWHPGPVALTATGIATFSQAAMTDADPRLAAPVDAKLPKAVMSADAARADVAAANAAYEVAAKADPADRKAEAASLAALQLAQHDLSNRLATVVSFLVAWKPLDTKNAPQKDVDAYRVALLKMAKAAQRKAATDAKLFDGKEVAEEEEEQAAPEVDDDGYDGDVD